MPARSQKCDKPSDFCLIQKPQSLNSPETAWTLGGGIRHNEGNTLWALGKSRLRVGTKAGVLICPGCIISAYYREERRLSWLMTHCCKN